MIDALKDNDRPSAGAAEEFLRAVEVGDADEVGALLAGGADAGNATANGETALMRASSRGCADVARVLLGAGAEVNAEREDGFSALMLSALYGHADVARLLLEHGADPAARTRLGSDAEKWAASRGFEEIVELLREARAARPRHARANPEAEARVAELSTVTAEHDGRKTLAGALSGAWRQKAITAALGPATAAPRVGPDSVTNPAGVGPAPEDAEREATLIFSESEIAPLTAPRPAPLFSSPAGNFGSRRVNALALALIVASGALTLFVWRNSGRAGGSRPPQSHATGPQSAPAGAPLPVVPQPAQASGGIEAQSAQPLQPATEQSLQGDWQYDPALNLPPVSMSSVGEPAAVQTDGPRPGVNASPLTPSVVSEGDRSPAADEAGASPARPAVADQGAASSRNAVGEVERREEAGRQGSSSAQAAPRGAEVRGGAATARPASPPPPPAAPAPAETPKKKVIQWP